MMMYNFQCWRGYALQKVLPLLILAKSKRLQRRRFSDLKRNISFLWLICLDVSRRYSFFEAIFAKSFCFLPDTTGQNKKSCCFIPWQSLSQAVLYRDYCRKCLTIKNAFRITCLKTQFGTVRYQPKWRRLLWKPTEADRTGLLP